MADTATKPNTAHTPVRNGKAAQPAIPFPLASRKMTRLSFSQVTTALSATAPTLMTPIQLPAMGYLSHVNLEVSVAITGGTTPAFTPDAPFNVLQTVEFKTAAGNDIVVPMTGYQLYCMNKYGCQFAASPMSDARMGMQYSANASSGAHFFLQVPLELDAANGYGSIPALASNRSYQLNIVLAAISSLVSGAPTSVTVSITGTAHYWSEPPASTASGAVQATAPSGVGTISQWQIEQPSVNPGDRLIKSNNTGNVLRTLIFTLRNASGARIDTNGWPSICELYLDNEPMFYLSQNEWSDLMCKWYNFQASSKDVANGLDTGVYVIPFHALASNSFAGNTGNSRAQLLPTLDASQLQLRGTSWGSAVAGLEIITNSVIPTDAATLYSR